MKKVILVLAAAGMMTAPLDVLAATEHDHGAMKMEHDHAGMMEKGKAAHEEVVDGVKVKFTVHDMQKKMKEMGRKETHHIMVMFTDAASGNPLSEGEAKLKVVGPDKKEEVKDLMGMGGGFGADFTMPQKGKYGVMAKFKVKDGKVRSVKFYYTVK